MHRSPVDCAELVEYWVGRLDQMLNAVVRDRAAIPADRSLDVRFDDFMADDLSTAERVLELAGEPLTVEGRAGRAAYLAGHQRGRLGRVATSPEMFGLREAELRERFAPYVQRFLE